MNRKALLLATAFGLVALPAAAENVVRWASASDPLTMDPHGQNEGPTATLSHHIYEPLLHRDTDLEIVPALATDWSVTDDPEVWQFNIREGVSFHDGSPLTASDVVFSLNRANGETSDYRGLLTSIAEVVAVDEHTVHVITDGPNPLLPNNLTNLFIMDEEWAVAHGVETAQDFAAGDETFAVRNANGTGAYMLEQRIPDDRTVLVRNPDYWGADAFPAEIDRIIYTPITNDATRVAALLSGEIDFLQDPPLPDLERLAAEADIEVTTTPQNRVVFLGMWMVDEDHVYDGVDGANPYASHEVRRAMDLAIDREAIRQVVMRGQSTPAGMISPPFVHGYSAAMDAVMTPDLDQAQELLAQAGYADGFSADLHCPNDRYINDEEICQAVVGMLGRIGIEINLVAQPKSVHFAELSNREMAFYMLGWGVPTFDSEYIFSYLFHTDDGTRGSWNGTGYSDARVDALTVDMVTEVDVAARDAMIEEVWRTVNAEVLYLPLHHQVINWAMSSAIDVPIRGDNQVMLKYATFN